MRILVASLTGSESNSVTARSSLKGVATVVAAFALSSVCALGVTPVAIAETSDPGSSGAGIHVECAGKHPGSCPGHGGWQSPTGAASSASADSSSHDGPLCPGAPGVCPA